MVAEQRSEEMRKQAVRDRGDLITPTLLPTALRIGTTGIHGKSYRMGDGSKRVMLGVCQKGRET